MTVNFNGVIRMMGILFLVLGFCLIPSPYRSISLSRNAGV